MSTNTEHFGATPTRVSSFHRKSLESRRFGETPAINVSLLAVFIRNFLSTLIFFSRVAIKTHI